MISSETCAFEVMGIYESVDLKPGEIVEFHKGIVKHEFIQQTQIITCVLWNIFTSQDQIVW